MITFRCRSIGKLWRLSCPVLLVCLVNLSHGGLYSSDGPVVRFTPDNFTSSLQQSTQIWVVEFYAAWCGYCQRFAPDYTQFANDIQAWKPVIGVGAAHCFDPAATEMCIDYGVQGFPTLKLFPPRSSPSERGTVFDGDKSIQHVLQGVLNYLVRLVEQGRSDPTWPHLSPVRQPSELVVGSSDKRPVFIVIEDDQSVYQHTALMVLLDLLPLRSSVIVGRMHLNDTRVVGITGRGLFSLTKFNSLFPVNSAYNRQSLAATIRQRIGAEQSSIVSTTTVATDTATDNTEPADRQLIAGLHQQDIESSVYYSLWVEVPAATSFNESALNALRAYIGTMAKYLPGEYHLMNFLQNTSAWLSTQTAPLASTTWLQQISNTQTADAYVPNNLRWTWCQGSQPQYRGYPCSLWMTFHALTVNAYLQELNNPLYSPREVISSIRGYVQHFLSCRECAGHFGGAAVKLLDSGNATAQRYLAQRDGAAVWLWMAHNRANQHLHGDVTEDPTAPKIQFPAQDACPACWLDAEATAANETAVMAYLVQYYGAPYVIDDDIHEDSV
jgi:thiol oxidase